MKVQFHLLVVFMLAFALMALAPVQSILIEEAAAESHEENPDEKKKKEGEEEEPDC